MTPKSPIYRSLFISIAVSAAALALDSVFFSPVFVNVFFASLVFPLIRLMGFIFLGLALGQIIEILGWTRQVAILARPLFRFSRMGHHCSAAFTTAFISGAAANAMLLAFYRERKISKTQLFLANYINQFPAFFLHLPTTMFIVLPLTGMAGALYFAITFIATLSRTVCFLIFGHFFLATNSEPYRKSNFAENATDTHPQTPHQSLSIQELTAALRKKLPGRVTRIFIWVLPVYTLVFLFSQNGLFDTINQALIRYIAIEVLPVETLSIVVLSFAAEFTSGFAAAGALMNAGILSTKQTVIALLCGNVLAFPIRAIRHQLPRYMGIFSPKMGLELLLSGQLFRVASIIVIGSIYFFIG